MVSTLPLSTSSNSLLSAGRSMLPPEYPPSSNRAGSARHPSSRWLIMKAWHASRCASRELKDISNPSSEDLRVYMAQRTACLRLRVVISPSLLLGGFQTEKEGSRPSGARDKPGYL